MKSQDVLLMLKLVSLSQAERSLQENSAKADLRRPHDWQDWQPDYDDLPSFTPAHTPESLSEELIADQYSVRGLAASTGISKSQVSLALRRCEAARLVRPDRVSGYPRANSEALLEFLIHGLRYVFPVEPGAITRGIATGLGAPVLEGALMTAGEWVPVWPDARGRTKGVGVTPIYMTVPTAVRQDARLYALLALADALRLGRARERQIASERLTALVRGMK